MRGLDKYLSGERVSHEATQGCECSDPGCAVHRGTSCKCAGEYVLYRIDMQDETGTLFCEDCANDADASGLFSERSASQREQDATDALEARMDA